MGFWWLFILFQLKSSKCFLLSQPVQTHNKQNISRITYIFPFYFFKFFISILTHWWTKKALKFVFNLRSLRMSPFNIEFLLEMELMLKYCMTIYEKPPQHFNLNVLTFIFIPRGKILIFKILVWKKTKCHSSECSQIKRIVKTEKLIIWFYLLYSFYFCMRILVSSSYLWFPDRQQEWMQFYT